MAVKEKRDYLYLIWKSESDRRQYIIGELSKNSHYEFKYSDEVKQAEKEGFTLLVAFPNINVTYTNAELFPVFESRLPDKKRKDIKNILAKYDMEEYEPYQLLKRSGARLPIDNLYFIDPILDTDNNIKRVFHMAGVRHYIGCDGLDCDKSLDISKGEEVELELEPDNVKDKKAVKVLNKRKQKLGYIPRYYSKEVFELIQQGRNLKCSVLNVDKNQSCDECVKLVLETI